MASTGDGPLLRTLRVSDPADSGDLAAGEVEVEVPEMIHEVVEGFPLGPVVGVFREIAEPGVVLLPVDVFHRLHRLTPRDTSDRDGLGSGLGIIRRRLPADPEVLVDLV